MMKKIKMMKKKEQTPKRVSMGELHQDILQAYERIRIALKVKEVTPEVFFFDEYTEDNLQEFIQNMLEEARDLLGKILDIKVDNEVLYAAGKQYTKKSD